MAAFIGLLDGSGPHSFKRPAFVRAVQAETAAGRGALTVLRGIYQNEGLAGLFKGFWFNVLLCVNPAIQNTCFDTMKGLVRRSVARKNAAAGLDASVKVYLTPLQAFTMGAIAKAVATCVTYPLVRLKTILQAGMEPREAPISPAKRVPSARLLEEMSSGRFIRRTSHDAADENDEKADTRAMLRSMSWHFDRTPSKQGPLQRLAALYRGIGSALTKSVLQAAFMYMTKDQVETLVRHLIRRIFRNQLFAPLKLGAFSGRPLAS